jgi:hypothetical protein
MRAKGVVLAGLLLLLTPSNSSLAQTCGFPWTVTGIPGTRSQAAVINVCGIYHGCRPHNPRFTIHDSQIDVTFQTSEPPDACQCIAVDGTFQGNVVVQPLPPGDYAVTVTLLSCSSPEVVGATTFSQGVAFDVPALDRRGVIAVILLLSAVGLWALRTGS